MLEKHGLRDRLLHRSSTRKDKAEHDRALAERAVDGFRQAGCSESYRGPSLDSSIPSEASTSKWPSTAQIRHLTNAQANGSGSILSQYSYNEDALQQMPLRAERPPHVRRGTGLSVTFSDSQPEVIGEGGEESDVPTIQISRRRAQSQPSRRPVPQPSGNVYDQGRSRAASVAAPGVVPAGGISSGEKSLLPSFEAPYLQTAAALAPYAGHEVAQREAISAPPVPSKIPEYDPLLDDTVHNSHKAGLDAEPRETRQPLARRAQGGQPAAVLRKDPPQVSTSAARIQARQRMGSEEGALHRANSGKARDESISQERFERSANSNYAAAAVSPSGETATVNTAQQPSKTRPRITRDAYGSSQQPPRTPTGEPVAFLSLGPDGGRPPSKISSKSASQYNSSRELTPDLHIAHQNQFRVDEVSPRKLDFRDRRPTGGLPRAVPGQFQQDSDSDSSDDPVPEPLIKVPTGSALELFSDMVKPLAVLFRLSAESYRSIDGTPFRDWIRTAVWWFTNGQADMALALQNVPPDFPPHQALMDLPPVRKAFVDLAKSWWIIDIIAPSHPRLNDIDRDGAGALIDAVKTMDDPVLEDAVQMWEVLNEEFTSVAPYLEENRVLVPGGNDVTLLQGADTSVWIPYPSVSPHVADILGGPDGYNGLSDMFAVTGEAQQFTSGRMLVETVVTVSKGDEPQLRFLCLFTLSRDPRTGLVRGTVASQSSLLSLAIQDDSNFCPTWADLDWHIPSRVITLVYHEELTVAVCFGENDFAELCRLAQPQEATYSPPEPIDIHPNEHLAFERKIKSFQNSIIGTDGRSQMVQPVPDMMLRLFEQLALHDSSIGTVTTICGLRVAVINEHRPAEFFESVLGGRRPIIFQFLRGEGGAPAMMLRVGTKPSRDVILTFDDPSDRSVFLAIMGGQQLRSDEMVVKEMSLKSMSVTFKSQDQVDLEPTNDFLWTQSWTRFYFVDVDPRSGPHPDALTTDRRRFCADFGSGTLTDRLSGRLGDVLIALSPVRGSEICVVRPVQDNATVTVAKGQISQDMHGCISYTLQNMTSAETMRRYRFNAVQDLHFFQLAMTGYAVLYDGLPVSFSITRRRTVVALHKKWESTVCRLQIVRKNQNVQLLAFFKDFQYGQCMSVPLKPIDVFELFSKGGKHMLVIVEAKFALPKNREMENRAFLSLDNPEYPSEHDDITIVFDSDMGEFG